MKTLIIFVTVVSTVLFEHGAPAAPQLMLSSSYGIDGFEHRYGGFLWWNTHGVCSGEFPNLAAVQYIGAITAPTKTIATNCNIMTGYFDNPVRDGVNAYYFAGRQLVRKALSAALSDPAQNVLTPPFSPTLAVGQLGSALEIHDTTLYFARYTNATGANMIYSFDLKGTNGAVAEGGFDVNSEVAQIQYFEYDDNRVVRALAVLTENGRLYRIKLNALRGEPAVTLLATGVSYFAIRTGGFALGNTYIFATKGPRAILGEIAPGGPGTLWRVHPETGSETLLYTAQQENVLIGVAATGHDSEDDSYLFLAEGIVSGPQGGFQSITEVALRRHSATVLSGSWDTILLQGAGWNLRGAVGGKSLFMLRNNGIYAIPSGAAPIQFDMRAVGLEAVQAIQSYTHSVSLVANRPTFVRGYASIGANTTGQNEWFATATLRAFLNGQELAGGPIAPINNVPVKQVGGLATMRANPTNTFLFELPPEWTRPGSLPVNFMHFVLTVNPDLAIPETPSNPLANNSVTSPPVRIVARGKPCLVMVPVYSVGPEYNAHNDPLFPEMIERARSLMPVEDFDVHTFSAIGGDPDDPLNFQYEGSDADTQEERDNENRLYRSGQWGDANDQAEDLGSESDLCDSDDIHYIAMVHPDAVITPPGGTGENPGNAFSMLMGGGSGDTQSPRAGRVLAHELGHNYGRSHIECGNFPEDQADFDDVPFPGSLGNPDASLPTATFGFDPLNFLVLRPTDACDVMSYGSVQWTTAVFWNTMLGEVPGPNQLAGASARSAGSAGGLNPIVMLVRGQIFPKTKTALFRHFSGIPESVAPARNLARSRGEAREAARRDPLYLLRQLDGAGNLLIDTAILARHSSYHEPNLVASRFSQYIDLDSRARTLQLVSSNIVFAERFISLNAPTLALGTSVLDPAAQTISLNWTAADADGDPLRFSIHHTGDDGLHWGALKTDYKALSITLGTRWLAGGTRCRLRVIAHDGANSTIAVTPPFACPKHAPEPSIHGIREGQSIPFGQPLRFKAIAFDAEEGSSLPTRFWQLLGPDPHSNNGDNFNIASLAPGVHTLKFTAIDTDGQSNTVSRSFEVAPLTIPEAAIAPTLDGQPNDSAYANAAFVQLPFGTGKVLVRLIHHGGYLYASIANLRYATSVILPNRTAGLRFDVNASRNATATTGDIGFFVDEDGVPYQEVAQGGSMVKTLSPQPGFTAIIYRGSNLWSAELQIADSLLGGWNHLAGLMIAHSSSEWPPLSLVNQPNTWAPVWLGAAPVSPTNKPPFAVAGSDIALSLSHPSEVTVDASASYDPEGAPLNYAWQQIAGPAVTLTNPNGALCEFTAPVVGNNTEFRFRLTVNDGTQSSAPDEVIVLVRPPPTPALPVPLRGFAELRDDGLIQLRLVGESARTYRVQTSADLISWTDFRTVVGDLNGAIDLTVDPRTFRDPARFFRAVSP